MFWPFSFSFQSQLFPITQPTWDILCQFLSCSRKKKYYHSLSGHERHKSQEKRDMAPQILWMEAYLTCIFLPFPNITLNSSQPILLKKEMPEQQHQGHFNDQDMFVSLWCCICCMQHNSCIKLFIIVWRERILWLNHVFISTRISVNNCIKCCRDNLP